MSRVDHALPPPTRRARRSGGRSAVHVRQRPAPACQLTSDGHIRHHGPFRRSRNPPSVRAGDGFRHRPGRGRRPALIPPTTHHRPDVISRPMMPRRLDQQPLHMGVPGLVIDRCIRDAPDDYSDGTRPTMIRSRKPVNRFQSPISTAPTRTRSTYSLRAGSRPPDDRSQLTRCGHPFDRGVEAPPPGLHRQHIALIASNAIRVVYEVNCGAASGRQQRSGASEKSFLEPTQVHFRRNASPLDQRRRLAQHTVIESRFKSWAGAGPALQNNTPYLAFGSWFPLAPRIRVTQEPAPSRILPMRFQLQDGVSREAASTSPRTTALLPNKI